MRDNPFPPPRGKNGPTLEWARQTMERWRKTGYPELIGPPAEQVQLAGGMLDQIAATFEEVSDATVAR